MKYIRVEDAKRAGVNLNVANINKTGSVRGMVSRFGWIAWRAVRVGGYIYHLEPRDIQRHGHLIRQ